MIDDASANASYRSYWDDRCRHKSPILRLSYPVAPPLQNLLLKTFRVQSEVQNIKNPTQKSIRKLSKTHRDDENPRVAQGRRCSSGGAIYLQGTNGVFNSHCQRLSDKHSVGRRFGLDGIVGMAWPVWRSSDAANVKSESG